MKFNFEHMITPLFIYCLTVAALVILAAVHLIIVAHRKHWLSFLSEREEFFIPGDNLHDDDDDDDEY